jgi:DNA-binding beta-propeller fold protein YncE
MKSIFLLLLIGLTIEANATTAEGFLGVVNKSDGTASIINVKNGETKVFKTGFLPHEISFANDSAYISNYGSHHVRSSDVRNVPGNTLSVISMSSGSVSEINLGAARCAPHGMAASKDGKHLYITCEGRHEIAVLDTATGKISHFLPTNQAGSHLLVISSDETRAYVTNFWLGSVSVIDLVQRKIIKQVFVGRGCEGVGISLDDQFLYVTRVEDAELVKLDTKTLEVVGRIKFSKESSPIRVTMAPNNPNQILVNDVGSGVLSILNANSLDLIKEIKVGNQPIGLAASETHAFVANMKDDTISVINLKSTLIEAVYPTGKAPDGISFTR